MPCVSLLLTCSAFHQNSDRVFFLAKDETNGGVHQTQIPGELFEAFTNGLCRAHQVIEKGICADRRLNSDAERQILHSPVALYRREDLRAHPGGKPPIRI